MKPEVLALILFDDVAILKAIATNSI